MNKLLIKKYKNFRIKNMQKQTNNLDNTADQQRKVQKEAVIGCNCNNELVEMDSSDDEGCNYSKDSAGDDTL